MASEYPCEFGRIRSFLLKFYEIILSRADLLTRSRIVYRPPPLLLILLHDFGEIPLNLI